MSVCVYFLELVLCTKAQKCLFHCRVLYRAWRSGSTNTCRLFNLSIPSWFNEALITLLYFQKYLSCQSGMTFIQNGTKRDKSWPHL